MNINSDLSMRVVVRPEDHRWVPSPEPGVERVMLDRVGDEVARATSLVRYAPGSKFSAHVHEAGEEFLVLEGEFLDQYGRYPVGSYVRNPPGSSHAPASEIGTLLFVKLRQFEAEDRSRCVVDTRICEWRPGVVEGLSVLPLHDFGVEHVALVRWQPGTQFHRHTHPGGEEILVLEGELADESGRYPKGSWLRNPPWSAHRPYTENGALLYVKTGHLAAL